MIAHDRAPVRARGGLLGRSVGAACWLLCAWLCAAIGLELYGATRPAPERTETVVVAGAGVLPGGVPSHSLFARTERAVALFRHTDARVLAFTGGRGEFPPSESEVGARIARAYGVSGEVMVREERSTNTEENARELRSLLGDEPIVVVTDRYHVLRCERVFSRYFSEVQVVGALSPPGVRMRGALREVLAIASYALRGRLWRSGAGQT